MNPGHAIPFGFHLASIQPSVQIDPTPSFPYSLIITLAVFAGAAAWLFWKRRAPRGLCANRALRIVESCGVGPRQFIIVAACGSERVLLGVSPSRIDMLCKLDNQPSQPDESGPADYLKGSFAQVLTRESHS